MTKNHAPGSRFRSVSFEPIDDWLGAKPGDYLKISGHKAGESARHAEILKVQGDKGGPPYYVRWPDGHESLVYPGSDIVIEHKRRKSTAGRVPVTR